MEKKDDVLKILGKTVQLDPNLFPEDLQPELFRIQEDQKWLIFALYSTKVVKIYKLDKESPGSLPQLILNKTAQNIILDKQELLSKSESKSHSQDANKLHFLISKEIGAKNLPQKKTTYSDFRLSDQDLKKLPEAMRPYLRSKKETQDIEGKSTTITTHSIRVKAIPRNKDSERLYASKSIIEQQKSRKNDYLLIKSSRNSTGSGERVLFKLNSLKWLRKQFLKIEKKFTNKKKIRKTDFENKYWASLERGLKPLYPSFRLSTPQESLRFTNGGRRREVVHIAARFDPDTNVVLKSVNLRLRKVIRTLVVNFMPEFHMAIQQDMSPCTVLGLIWDAENDRAVVSIKDMREKKATIFKRVDNLSDPSKRSFEVLLEVPLCRRSPEAITWGQGLINYLPEYQEKVYEGFKDSLQTDPETGELRSGVLYTQMFTPFIKAVLLRDLKSKVKGRIKHSLPLRGLDDNQRLTLLASDKSLLLYNTKSSDLIWEMPFKYDIAKNAKIAQGNFCSLDNLKNELNFFGVVGHGKQYFGLRKTIDLNNLALFDCFGAEREGNDDKKMNFDYLRLLDLYYLKNEKKYLIVIQKLSLRYKPVELSSRIAEEIVAFERLTKRWPEEDEAPDHHYSQQIGFIKLSPQLDQITQKLTLRYPTTERITTSINGDCLSILRAKMRPPREVDYGRLAYNEFHLDFYNFESLQEKSPTTHPSRSFLLSETWHRVTEFIYEDPGYLFLVFTQFRGFFDKDREKRNKKDRRLDRVDEMKVRSKPIYSEDKMYAFTFVFDDVVAQQEEKDKSNKNGAEKGGKSGSKAGRRRGSGRLGGRLSRAGSRQGTSQAKDEVEKMTEKRFGNDLRGAKILSCQPLSEDCKWEIRTETAPSCKVGVPRSVDQLPSGFFSFSRSPKNSELQTLKLRYWDKKIKNLRWKKYVGYFGRFKGLNQAQKRTKNDYITVSDLFALDESRLVLLEYQTSLKHNNDLKNTEPGGNSEFELNRNQKFELAYLDVRNQSVKWFRVEAPNLILNRMMLWERSSSAQNTASELIGEDRESSFDESDRLIMADFDEEMNLVLIDLEAVLKKNPQKDKEE